MLRRLIVFLLLAAPVSLQAAIWTELLGEYKRVSVRQLQPADAAVWEEYGLEAAEEAVYRSDGQGFTATAYRLRDSTCGLAVFQWLSPKAGKQVVWIGLTAIESAGGTLAHHGNYVFHFQGGRPLAEVAQTMFSLLPRVELSPLPVLPGYLPAQGLIGDSRRLVIGPASLASFEPRIPPAAAAFSLGAEGQLARYNSPAGTLGLALFSYPTPNIARKQAEEFQKLPGAVVKRSGPLVAIILSPPDPNEAERLLAKVNYNATITWNEQMPQDEGNIGDFLIAVFKLIGLMIGFTLLAGAAFAGLRILRRRLLGESALDEVMVRLHLEDR